jgi:class 3 adenylate cyclase
MRATNVTFLFTDLVESTRILDRLGDRAGEEVMRSHFDMLRTAISQSDGHVVKTLGDGVMAIVRQPSAGIACAVAMQHGVTRHNRTNPAVQLAMRVGVHCGPAIRMAGDYYGIPVIIAKRLCDHCTGGQVIVSETLREHITDNAGVYRDLGQLTCKGLSGPVHAAELCWVPRPQLCGQVEQ